MAQAAFLVVRDDLSSHGAARSTRMQLRAQHGAQSTSWRVSLMPSQLNSDEPVCHVSASSALGPASNLLLRSHCAL
eukprot:CAMPEP_0168456254 /NCGR_PEP_ID=MMETSP0228-20121227/51195_1 /TAXON_ID=133427 /ORGANISM="Protoceratium reticulatum, Strain CCCM 535 (=CCMP 1889)" /LENGTH=75 /DNA_ID=CAMNT_0008471173 /DNA_START=50 /DNA_END=275 /DNA_ORIENTATION=-